jgi:hypothetical protein
MAIVIDGNNTPTAGGIGYGDGTELAFTAAGTSGRPIVSGGAGAPTFRPYTLPAADGSANQILQTDGAGALSFATPGGGFTAMSVITSSGTFTIPTGKTVLKVTVVGAGGGGTGVNSTNAVSTAGVSGGFSRVASGTQTISNIDGNGGSGGAVTQNPYFGSSGGSATGGDLNFTGSAGNTGVTPGQAYFSSGSGGSSFFGGGAANVIGNTVGIAGSNYGGGGSGGARSSNMQSGSGGGGGGTAIKYLTSLTPGNTLTITVGSGGAGGVDTSTGGAGANGVVVIEY